MSLLGDARTDMTSDDAISFLERADDGFSEVDIAVSLQSKRSKNKTKQKKPAVTDSIDTFDREEIEVAEEEKREVQIDLVKIDEEATEENQDEYDQEEENEEEEEEEEESEQESEDEDEYGAYGYYDEEKKNDED